MNPLTISLRQTSRPIYGRARQGLESKETNNRCSQGLC
jgi:hypothetical protein